jgi:hypothetical protein
MAAPDYNSILQQSTQQATQAIQPALGALEAQKQPLTARYDNLIKQLGEQQGLATKNTETQTTRDFGARGISPNSGLFSQTLGERVQPIVSDYTARIGGAVSDRENAMAELASRIAGLQSQASQSGIQNALSLYGQQFGAYQNQIEAEKQRQFAAQQAALDRQNQARATASARSSATPTFSVPSQSKTDYASLASNTLREQGNKDIYVDKNEAISAVKALMARGIPAAQAEALVEQSFSGGYLKKYKW